MKRLNKRGLSIFVALMAFFALAVYPVHAVVGTLNKDATGKAITSVCERTEDRLRAIKNVYRDLNMDSPLSRWKAFVDELTREYKTFEGSLKKIRPIPGVDGGITKLLTKIVSEQVVSLVKAQGLLKRGKLLDAALRTDALDKTWSSDETDVTKLMRVYGFNCQRFDTFDFLDAATNYVEPPPFDSKYFPALPDFSFSGASEGDKTAIRSTVNNNAKIFSGGEIRNLVNEDGSTICSVASLTFQPTVSKDPEAVQSVFQAYGASLQIQAEPIGGFSVAVGTASFIDRVLAVRSDVIYEFNAPSSPSQTAVRKVAALVLNAVPSVGR